MFQTFANITNINEPDYRKSILVKKCIIRIFLLRNFFTAWHISCIFEQIFTTSKFSNQYAYEVCRKKLSRIWRQN